MKKLLATLLMSTALIANAAEEKVEKYTHDFSVKVKGFTQNDNLNEKLSKLNIGYELSGTYNVNKNFYLTLSGYMYSRERFAVAPGVGAQMDLTKHFKPYVEAQAVLYTYRGAGHRVINYDFGLKYEIYNGLYVYGEADNFFESGAYSYTIGAGVPIYKNIVASASYNTSLKGHYNGLSVSIEYLF